ncbi:MAG: hypothetical protein GX345_00700 [Clostridiales bacterium]|nr:hypothetical protein [Clostridiales bacterium]
MNKKTFFQVLRRWPIYLWFHAKGVRPGRWDRLYGYIKHDFFKYKETSFKQKLWAYKRGFLSEEIKRYGLNEDNYKNYISSFDYFKKSAYVNERFDYWFNDKLTTWFVLHPFLNCMPEHYYFIGKNQVRELGKTQNAKDSIEGVVELLIDKGKLAMKETRGSHGSGFTKLTHNDGEFKINNKVASLIEVKDAIKNSNDYIVTEYVEDHPEISKIYSMSKSGIEGLTPGVMRVITVYDETKGAQIIGAAMRLGSKKSGLLTDYDGALYAGIRMETGELFRPLINVGSFGTKPCEQHPDTGVTIEGMKVPNWTELVTKVVEISNYLSNTPHLTFDIVMSKNGMKILEINSHGLVRTYQTYYPFFENESARKLFKPKG